MTTNLFIKETYLNESEGYNYGDSGWYETFTDDKGKLFKSLRKEYGKPSKMYRDTDNGAQQVGWVFSGTAKYEDSPKETYKRSVWVEVSETEPQKECTTKNINYPF